MTVVKLNQRRNFPEITISGVTGGVDIVATARRELESRAVIVGGVLGDPSSSGRTLRINHLFVEESESTRCSTNEECTYTLYHSFVENPRDCYCSLCPEYPLNKQVAFINQASYNRFCTKYSQSCPIARCFPMPEIGNCEEGRCVSPPQ